jgi:hypothetical protein
MMSTRLQANATAGETISCVAGQVAARHDIARIDKHALEAWCAEATERSLYLLDVRTPEEYETGHLRGAWLAPGGQLVQETDIWRPGALASCWWTTTVFARP